jgi:hypothetical protein
MLGREKIWGFEEKNLKLAHIRIKENHKGAASVCCHDSDNQNDHNTKPARLQAPNTQN